MKKLPIAIISDTFAHAYEWFTNKHKSQIKEFHSTHGMFVMHDGTRYVIVCKERHANNLNFSDYIICPTYKNLVDVVKMRIL